MKRPDPRALAVSAAAILFVLGGFVWPLTQKLLSNHAEILAYRERLEQLATQRSSVSASSFPASQELDAEQSGLLPASTVAEANRKIETYLLNALRATGGDSLVFRPAAGSQDMGLQVLTASVSARVPLDGAIELLHQLETGSPALFFDMLRLQGMPTQDTSPQDASLAMTGTIRAYVILPEKAAP
ncbi:type II secretion system protein GspM [Microvirga sp. 2YAF29]|uniref:type II secretion system protein GspM n=1 Tax=Microvirga sp. 2YAF29 TaxID=3233031 RepID=UPI003F9A4DFE